MSAALLANVPLLAGLPAADLERLATTLTRVEVAPSAVLFSEGDRAGSVYTIVSGELEVIKSLGTEDERLLRVMGPGSLVGEMALLNPDGLRTATVRAQTAVQLLELTRDDIEALLHARPALAYDMARSLSVRLNAANNGTIEDLREKNRQLTIAYQELQAAQALLIEKEALERELRLARDIQESMLPRTLPQLAGYDFGARMVAARTVGGDFFDFIPLSRDRLGIVIGDVSGKGMPAALFMALTRSLVRTEASRRLTPAAALQRVNGHLLQMNEAGMFVTVLYGVLQRRTGMFTYARAGHELPLMVGPDCGVQAAPRGQGIPLGLFAESALDEQTIALPPGGSLLLYTDGVTDAQNPAADFYGLERLQESLCSRAGIPADTLCADVLQTVLDYAGSAPQFDDVTIVGVHRSG